MSPEEVTAVAAFQRSLVDNNVLVQGDDGELTTRWEKYGVQLKIVCAAVQYGDLVIPGVRHYCPITRSLLDVFGLASLRAYGTETQGFVDQYGVFHDREEAFQIALEAGQIVEGKTEHPSKLFSEDLY